MIHHDNLRDRMQSNRNGDVFEECLLPMRLTVSAKINHGCNTSAGKANVVIEFVELRLHSGMDHIWIPQINVSARRIQDCLGHSDPAEKGTFDAGAAAPVSTKAESLLGFENRPLL